MYFLNHVRVNNNDDRMGLKVYTPVAYETLEDARKQLERTVEIIKKGITSCISAFSHLCFSTVNTNKFDLFVDLAMHPYGSLVKRDLDGSSMETWYISNGDEKSAKENDWVISCAMNRPMIDDVIFNDPATIVFWDDGTKTVVKCQEGDVYSKETGLAMAMLKRYMGNDNTYNKEINAWLGENE